MKTLLLRGPGVRLSSAVLVAANVACSRPPFTLAELPGPGDVEQQGSCIMMQHQIPGATLVSEEAKPGTQRRALQHMPSAGQQPPAVSPSRQDTQVAASNRLRLHPLPHHAAPQPGESQQAQLEGSSAMMPRGQSAQLAPEGGQPPRMGSKWVSVSNAITQTTTAFGTKISSLLMAFLASKTATAVTQALQNMTRHGPPAVTQAGQNTTRRGALGELIALTESAMGKPSALAITFILPAIVFILVLIFVRTSTTWFHREGARQPHGFGSVWPSSQRGSRPDTRAVSPGARSHSLAAPSRQGTSDAPRFSDPMGHSNAASSCLSSLPSRRSMGAPGVMHLCAELVVPEDTECNLLVPELSTNAAGATDRITIHDSSGLPVFHASYSRNSRQSQLDNRDTKRLILWSAIDGLIFAFCRDVEAALGHASGLAIFHHYEVPFGVLRQNSHGDRSAYSVLMHSGREVFFYQTSEDVGFRAEDENGRLLAMVMGLAPRCVRIGPQVDAGLVTLAMLGIDLLELDARRIAC